MTNEDSDVNPDDFQKHLRAGDVFATREERHAPRGFFVSGTSAMAYQYWIAASDLAAAAVEAGTENQVAHPVIFLYRHAVELTLKAICDEKYLSPGQNVQVPTTGHRILEYWDPVVIWLQGRGDWDEIMDTLDLNVRLLASADIDGMTFRYADDKALRNSVPISFEVGYASSVLNEVVSLLNGIQTMRYEEASVEREIYGEYLSQTSHDVDPSY